jgi:hypothetical protein
MLLERRLPLPARQSGVILLSLPRGGAGGNVFFSRLSLSCLNSGVKLRLGLLSGDRLEYLDLSRLSWSSSYVLRSS